jgi:arabinogalactan endo-1,4-beta-galactosidase
MRKLNITLTGCILFICIGFLTITTINDAKAQIKGADLSWVTQMEASGYKWKDANGNYGDIFAICKGLGINACRLRVWVNPSGGWCGKADVIAKAKRAKAQGMYIFIAFHFSDSWADPAKQNKPSAWASHNISQLYTDVYNHVRDVLSGLISAGCTPYLVQIGNETNNGLLWPEGKASTYPKQYAGLITSGYNAVKSLCSASVVVHVSNGWDNSLFRWNFDILKNNGAKYDAIGMSLYPSTSDWSTKISQCRTNIADMKSRYGKWCLLSEIGIAANSGSTGASFVKAARGLVNDVFYWEPEAYNWQGYGLGAWDYATQKPTVILTEGLKSAIEQDLVLTSIEKSNIDVYPNPLIGENININLNGLTGKTGIKILNVNGQVVRKLVSIDEQLVTIDKTGLKSGIYFIQIDNQQQKLVKTVVVK